MFERFSVGAEFSVTGDDPRGCNPRASYVGQVSYPASYFAYVAVLRELRRTSLAPRILQLRARSRVSLADDFTHHACFTGPGQSFFQSIVEKRQSLMVDTE